MSWFYRTVTHVWEYGGRTHCLTTLTDESKLPTLRRCVSGVRLPTGSVWIKLSDRLHRRRIWAQHQIFNITCWYYTRMNLKFLSMYITPKISGTNSVWQSRKSNFRPLPLFIRILIQCNLWPGDFCCHREQRAGFQVDLIDVSIWNCFDVYTARDLTRIKYCEVLWEHSQVLGDERAVSVVRWRE